MSPTRKLLLALFGVVVAGFFLYRLQSPSDGLGVLVGASGSDLIEEIDTSRTRLSDNVTPLAYRLRLTIDPRQDRFQGRAEIDVMLNAPASHIALNGKFLTVRRARVYTSGGEALPATWRDNNTGMADLILHRPLDAERATIVIDYEAPFNGDLEGLYKILVKDKAFAFTQFEATSARFAFPSFDEPRFKTPYHLSFRVPTAMKVIGNTPVLIERALDDRNKIVVLGPTPPLPSYLIAFAVGDFEVVDGAPVPPNELRPAAIPVRAVTVPGKGAETTLALAETPEFVRALEAYVGLPYPYEKLDLIAVPDFASSAMENPGAIMYRDTVMLSGPSPSFHQLYNFYDTHVHELAHQWFGNLVTPQWWDDIWLNESFADWLAAKIMTEQRPTLGFQREVQRGALSAMGLDSEPGAPSVHQPIVTQEGIDSAFNAINYEKGAAVLAMFENYIGKDRFQNAITRYLRAHANGNASTSDFLAAISETMGEEATSAAMRSFIDQPGVPLVNFDWDCPAQGVNITTAQKRYFPIGVPQTSASQWIIPLCVRLLDQGGKGQTQCVLTRRETQTFYLRDVTCPSAVVPNAGGAGYYRWRLSNDNWRKLADVVAQLSPAEALSFADSLSAAFRDGSLSVRDYLPIIHQLAVTSDWDAASFPMDDLKFLLYRVIPADPDAKAKAEAILANIYRPRLEFGLEHMNAGAGEGAIGNRELLRRLLDFYVRDLNDPALTAILAERGRQAVGYKTKPNRERSDYLHTELIAALMTDGPPFADFLINALIHEHTPIPRESIIFAMADTPRADVVTPLLDFLLSKNARTDELVRGLETLYHLPTMQPVVWTWVIDHIDAVAARMPEWMRGELANAASGFCDPMDRALAEEILRPRLEALGAKKRLDDALSAVDRCIALKAAVQEDALLAFGLATPPAVMEEGAAETTGGGELPPPPEAPVETPAPETR